MNAALELPPLKRISSSKSKLKTRLLGTIRPTLSYVKSAFEDRLMDIYLRGGWASRMMKRLKGELDSTPVANELFDLYSRKVVYDDRKIRDLIGYMPRFDLELGIEQTLHWFTLHEIIPSKSRVFLKSNAASTSSEDRHESISRT